MTSRPSSTAPPGQTWSAAEYRRKAAFVSAYGVPLLERLAPRAGEHILDLGCGDGVLTEQIVALGAQVVGVDTSADMIAAARVRGLQARQVDAQRLPFEAEFDAVFSNAALHWMPDADAVLAGVRRALKPGGRFVAEFGGHGCVAAIMVAMSAVLARHSVAFEHPWFFPTAEEYRERLERHGFSVEHLELYPRPTPLPTGIRGWLDVFATALLSRLAPELRDRVLDEVTELLRPVLCDSSGQWTADYVRLRLVARVPG
jgi:trans-aconitate methyltransferase